MRMTNAGEAGASHKTRAQDSSKCRINAFGIVRNPSLFAQHLPLRKMDIKK